MTDLNTTEANEAPTSDATMLNPADFTPKTEPTRKFSGDAHGIAEAASELRKSRERPAIKRWKLDGEKTFRDAREAAPWRPQIENPPVTSVPRAQAQMRSPLALLSAWRNSSSN
jgi:hypothetical protein